MKTWTLGLGLALLLGAVASPALPDAHARPTAPPPAEEIVGSEPIALHTPAADAPWVPAGLSPEALAAARDAARCARGGGLLGDASLLAVIDFGLPSTQPRLWILDEARREVLHHELVAHGKNTGDDLATRFSNIPNSNQSSLGLYRTAEIYTGKHGKSLRLDGLDQGFNDQARSRAIVMHGADYVSDEFVARVGRLGRSFGCPSVRREVSGAIIDLIAEGTPLFIWHPGSDWSETSSLARCG